MTMVAMASSLRCISRKAAANSHLLNSTATISSCTMKMSTLVSSNNNNALKSSSPWFMLPPSFQHKDINNNNTPLFNFISLSQDKVLNFATNIKSFMGDDVDYTDIRFVSSSHGWLTLYNPKKCDLYLFNPLSNRHIKLPPIHTLPISNRKLKSGFQCVNKLIMTSCSPEEEDCRVMMSYGPLHRLAFCCPTVSTAWTPIGALYNERKNDFLDPRPYWDFIYSTTQKLLYCITGFVNEEIEAWDLHDTESPKVIPMEFSIDKMEKTKYLARDQSRYLVRDEDRGHLYIVRRHVIGHMARDGSYVDYCSDKVAAQKLPRKTIGFDVYKYDEEKCAFSYMDQGSLDGLAFFIGNNHSFAIRASEWPELRPNCIYFTDSFNLIPPCWKPFGGHDLGIFNYDDKTFSPCYYPCDRQSIKKIIPGPMWFTPTNS